MRLHGWRGERAPPWHAPRAKHAVIGVFHNSQLSKRRFKAQVAALPPALCPTLPACSAAVESGLKEHLATAQRIIRLAQLARRHELPSDAAAAAEATAGDHGNPQLAAGTLGLDEQAAEGQAAGTSQASTPSSSDGGDGHAGGEGELGLEPGSAGQRLVEAFMQRTGSAALDGAALGQERLRLSAENATLKAVVAAVREGTGLGPSAVDHPLNTLLVVNGRLQRELGGAALARRAAAGPTRGMRV